MTAHKKCQFWIHLCFDDDMKKHSNNLFKFSIWFDSFYSHSNWRTHQQKVNIDQQKI